MCDHPGCGQVLSRADALVRHKRDRHPDAADAIECVTCSKRFFSKAGLAQHRQLNKCFIALGLPAAQSAGRTSEAAAATSEAVLVSAVRPSVSPPSSSAPPSPLSSAISSWSSPPTSTPPSNSTSTSTPMAASSCVRLTDEAIDAAVGEFLLWLSQPAANRDERGLKNARVLTETQRKDQVTQLRRLFYLAEQYFPTVFALGVKLAVVVDDAVVQRIQDHLEHNRERRARKRSRDDVGQRSEGVGAGARYKAYLLLKKILVFMAGKNRQQTGIDHGPDQFNSWQRVLTLCDDANKERDSEETDRLLFDDRTEEIMTKDEQHACLATCSQRLQQLRAVPLQQWTIGQRRSFEAHLVTALFLVLAGPRSQILAKMRVGTTLLRPGTPGNKSPPGCFEVQIKARETKNKRMGALLTVPVEYSDHLAWWIDTFVPAPGSSAYPGHVWLQKNGTPRTAFTDLTRLVTQAVIGRPISTHHFRHSEVSARADSEGPILAVVQGNSVDVQRQVYRVQDIREAQQRFAEQMMAGSRAVVV